MLKYLKRLNSEEQFKPGFFGFIFNPYYFNRKSIHTGIKALSPLLNGKLLDFGCGTKVYSKSFQVDEHVGVDLKNNEGHDLSTELVDVFYDGKTLPFEDNHFDSVFSSEVFEHVFNLDEILDEINRVHKSQGLLLITLPFVWREHEMPNDFGRYTSSGIVDLLGRHNYEVIEHIKSPGYFLSIVQLTTAYIHHHLLPRSQKIKFILAPIFIFPIHLIASVLNWVLPERKDLFINQTILAKNVKK